MSLAALNEADRDEADQEGLVSMEEVTPATLSNNFCSLSLLWQEYKFGINGRKPAEQFTKAEQNSKPNKTKIISQKHDLENNSEAYTGRFDSRSRHRTNSQSLRLQHQPNRNHVRDGQGQKEAPGRDQS